MRFDTPAFAGLHSPPAFATAMAAAFGLTTLLANLFAKSGPDEVETLLARGGARAALSILFSAAMPLAVALAISLAAAKTSGAPLRAMLRFLPRGKSCASTGIIFFLLGAVVAAPALGILSIPIGLTLEAIGITAQPQFAAVIIASPNAWPLPALAIAVSVMMLSPVAEEILFRALLWQGLCALTKRSEGITLAACAVFFAAMHGSAWAFIPLLIFAVVMSLVYRRFSLGCAIALHAGFNAGSTVLLLAA